MRQAASREHTVGSNRGQTLHLRSVNIFKLPIMHPVQPSQLANAIRLGVYNSAQYYWLQIMINNNDIDKNGTLALTFDLICGPFCTLWCIQYHNHAWVHLVWQKEDGGGRGGINQTVHMSREKTSHLQILCWQCIGERNTEPGVFWSYGDAIDPPVNLFSCIGTASPPPPPSPIHCFPPLIWYPLKVLLRPHF